MLPPRFHGLCRAASRLALLLATGLTTALTTTAALAWEPTAPITLVVPAGTGGGADQMARFIAQLAAAKQLLRQPINVVNMPGNSGMDGLQDILAGKGNPHKLVITLSNLFTAPLATGVDFSWHDITPVQMLAMDQFVLWVAAGSPYKTTKDLLYALRAAAPGTFKLGGTGSKQEDQLIGVLLETAAGTRISYVPLKGGGDVARALAAGWRGVGAGGCGGVAGRGRASRWPGRGQQRVLVQQGQAAVVGTLLGRGLGARGAGEFALGLAQQQRGGVTGGHTPLHDSHQGLCQRCLLLLVPGSLLVTPRIKPLRQQGAGRCLPGSLPAQAGQAQGLVGQGLVLR